MQILIEKNLSGIFKTNIFTILKLLRSLCVWQWFVSCDKGSLEALAAASIVFPHNNLFPVI
jgi:hypothetical protein